MGRMEVGVNNDEGDIKLKDQDDYKHVSLF